MCQVCARTFVAIMNNEFFLSLSCFWQMLKCAAWFICLFVFYCLFVCTLVCMLDSAECSFILICSVCGKKRCCNPVLQLRNTPLPIVYFSPPPATTAQGKTAQRLISTRALCDTRNPRQCCFSRYMQFSRNMHLVPRAFEWGPNFCSCLCAAVFWSYSICGTMCTVTWPRSQLRSNKCVK